MTFALFREHPRGLFIAAATEMWERFSYYGMRALLVFYLTQHFLFSDDQSFLIYGGYTAMVYLAPILGGAIADRWLGARKAVTLGALLLVLGHFGLAFEGPPAVRGVVDGAPGIVRSEPFVSWFFLCLSLIVLGVGFLKTNISAVVGALYAKNDPRRDSGFTIFYLCYNLGGMIAPLLCGYVGQTYGWRYGFGLAGVGMLAGLLVFRRGQRLLEGHAEPPDPARLATRSWFGVRVEWLVYLGSALLVVPIWLVLHRPPWVGSLVSAAGIGTSLWILRYAFAKCDREERRRLLACAALTLFTIGFWAFYEQMGSSLALFSDRIVDRTVFGREIPAASLQSLPSFFVVVLAPGFSALWLWLARRGREPSTAIKFSAAIGFIAVAFGVLALGTTLTSSAAKVSLGWFVANYFFLVVGELCLAPVGISMVTKLSPRRIVGVMMGVFLLAYSASSYLAGLIARLTSAPPSGDAFDPVVARAIYVRVYAELALLALGVMVLLLGLSPALSRLARLPDQSRAPEGSLGVAHGP
jgi:POT family proton-dependent oligopeptide transporter